MRAVRDRHRAARWDVSASEAPAAAASAQRHVRQQGPADLRRAALTSCRAYVSAVLPRGLRGQRPDSVPVELGRATVVLGVGVAGGAAVLVEEGRLRRRARGYWQYCSTAHTATQTLCHEGFSKD